MSENSIDDAKTRKRNYRVRKILENRLRNGFAKIMDDRESRFVLASFLATAGILQDGFDPDPNVHAHSAGWKSAGLWWVTQGLLHDPAFLGRLAADDDSPLKVQADDGHDDSSTDDDYSDSSN